jgi:hypothetical protein
LYQWIDQLRWQQLKLFQKLAEMSLSHMEEILNYGCARCDSGVGAATRTSVLAAESARGWPPSDGIARSL